MHDILHDFPGSQDGTRTEQFKAGTKRELSAYLAPLAVSAGWARLTAPEAEADTAPSAPENKATITAQSRGKRK